MGGAGPVDPQFAGFIESPPSVPSENLTVSGDGYTGASSATITETSSTKYTYSSSRTAGIDASVEVSAKTSLTFGAIRSSRPSGSG